MALKGELTWRGITISEAHAVVTKANHDTSYYIAIDGSSAKSLSALKMVITLTKKLVFYLKVRGLLNL